MKIPIKFTYFFIVLILISASMMFQNCGQNHGFNALSLKTSEELHIEDNLSDLKNRPECKLIQNDKETSLINNMDNLKVVLIFKQEYKNPMLCLSLIEDSRCLSIDNFADIGSLNGEFTINEPSLKHYIFTDFYKLIENSTSSTSKDDSNFSLYFLSEYHHLPLKIKDFTIKKPIDNSNIPSSSYCHKQQEKFISSELTCYKTPGRSIETETIPKGITYSYKFVADKNRDLRGFAIGIETTVYNGGSNRVDIAISPCPGTFFSEQKNCSKEYIKAGKIYTSFNSAENSNRCVLENGKEYYFNIRTNTHFPNAAKIIGVIRF